MPTIALKEWAVAVKAMELGKQDVIFRKGGIHEPAGHFQLEHREFLLYPAIEHQNPAYLKPEFSDLLQSVKAMQSGHRIEIRCKAVVKATHLVSSFQAATAYTARHIWNEDFIQQRLDYKPDRPLYIVELEIHPLHSPIIFTEATHQAGCKSWVTVDA